jgi:uncharacterized protein involved in exopolysaccharide biosynthesis
MSSSALKLDADEAEDSPARQHARTRALLASFERLRGLILLCAVAGALVALVYGVLRPNTYRSTGKLLVRWGARESASPEASVAGPLRADSGLARESVINQLHILSDPSVFAQTARALTPQRILSPYDPSLRDGPQTSWPVRTFHTLQDLWFRSSGTGAGPLRHPPDDCDRCIDASVLRLTKYMELEVEPYSNVLTISYTAHDAELAREVVAAFMEAGEKHQRGVHEVGTTLDFIHAELATSLDLVADAETDLSNFRVTCSTFDPSLQQAELLKKVREYEDQIALDEHRLAEARARAASLSKLLPTIPSSIQESRGRNIVPNPERLSMRDEIFKLEQELSKLDLRVGGTTKELELEREALKSHADRLRRQLEVEPPTIDLGPIVLDAPNARYARLAEQLDDAEQEIAALAAVADLRKQSLAGMQVRVNTIEQCKPQYSMLTARLEKARNRYHDFLTASQRAEVMKLLDTVDINNLLVIQAASTPLEKLGPKRGKLVLLGLLLGTFVGLAGAVVAHSLERRIQVAEELELRLGLEWLATHVGSARGAPAVRTEGA